MRKILNEAYLDYFNNYLTVALYAEHNGLTELQASMLIALGKDINNNREQKGGETL